MAAETLELAVLRSPGGWRVVGPNGSWRKFDYRVDAEEVGVLQRPMSCVVAAVAGFIPVQFGTEQAMTIMCARRGSRGRRVLAPARTPAGSARPYLQRLECFGALQEADVSALEARLGQVETFMPGKVMELVGEPPMFLVSGWACLAQSLRDGRRQILTFLLPGDGVGFDLLTRPQRAVQAIALTRLTVRYAQPGFIPGTERLSRGFAGSAAAQQGRLIDHLVSLGRRTSYERMAHLILELHGRLSEIGETRGESFRLPIKQEILADALGLSLVHVNRTLRQLRRDRLIALRGAEMAILDRRALEQASDRRTL
ncbi:Crp/Fnr family transcriptional regulator [Caulobacter segnis]